MFCCKVHKIYGKNELVVAVCDKDLVGKELRKNPSFKVSKEFYFDKECDEEEAVELMKKCTAANLIGEKIIQLAIERKFITQENIILIGDIPHAQFIK